MKWKNVEFKTVAAGCMLAGLHAAAHAIDSASLELGAGTETKIARVAAQSNWKQRWWQSNGSHIGGHWDFSLARWQGDRFRSMRGRKQSITSIGITPVFRWQRDDLKGPYAEAGIGIHYLSALYDNDGRQLSTRFQFGDHIGIGYVFRNNLDVSLRLQHFSNGSFKRPNDGVEFAVLRVSYPLR